MTLGWPNLEAGIWAVIISGLVGFATIRWGKMFDARGQAETALWNSAPTIMKELNEQTKQLRGEVAVLWERDRECHRELAKAERRISELERRMDDC